MKNVLSLFMLLTVKCETKEITVEKYYSEPSDFENELYLQTTNNDLENLVSKPQNEILVPRKK